MLRFSIMLLLAGIVCVYTAPVLDGYPFCSICDSMYNECQKKHERNSDVFAGFIVCVQQKEKCQRDVCELNLPKRHKKIQKLMKRMQKNVKKIQKLLHT